MRNEDMLTRAKLKDKGGFFSQDTVYITLLNRSQGKKEKQQMEGGFKLRGREGSKP